MIRTFACLSLAVLTAAACSPAPAADAAPGTVTPIAAAKAPEDVAGARAHVQALYDRYAADEIFSPFGKPAEWFDAEFVAALKAADAATPEGELGAIDADPFCSCQDPTGMKAVVGEAVSTGPGRAEVVVKLSWDDPEHNRVRIELTRSGARWRIHDVGEGEGGMLAYLRRYAANPDRASWD